MLLLYMGACLRTPTRLFMFGSTSDGRIDILSLLIRAMNESLDAVLNPRSVAIIGASEDRNKVGGRPLHYLLRFGYRGLVHPINRNRNVVQGVRALPDLDAIDTPPDVAVIAVAGDDAVAAVAACAKRGVRAAIVMSSGFGEIGARGRAAQEAMLASAQAAGMRLIGPNAQGVANFANGSVLNFSTMFMEVEPADGPIAIISQSGAASVVAFAHLRAAGFGVRYLIASGNDADLGVSELARAVAADPAVRLLLVYVESLRNPQMLADAAYRAAQRGVAMVLLMSGVSARGAAAAQSHTGSIVGGDDAIDAFALRHGIWRAHDLHELINAVPLYLQGASPGRGRSVIVAPSGAICVLCADAAQRIGLELSDLAPATLEGLTQVLPAFATAANPLDLTGGLLGNSSLFPKALGKIGADPAADMLLVGVTFAGPGYDTLATVEAIAGFVAETGKPVAVTAPLASTLAILREVGLPAYSNETDAIRALYQYCRHIPLLRSEPFKAPHAEPAASELPVTGGALNEHHSLALLARYAVPVYRNRLCRTPEEAVAAFHDLGDGPVTVKGCSAAVVHKSDHGLVYLDLVTAAAVESAARDCFMKMSRFSVVYEGVLVGEMVRRPYREFALGVKRDPVFGPLVIVAEGGTLIELRRDFVPLLAPFGLAEASAALLRLRLAPLLDGYRGYPALDVSALASAAVALGNFAIAAGPRLRSADINPILVLSRGEGALAVDAVIELEES